MRICPACYHATPSRFSRCTQCCGKFRGREPAEADAPAAAVPAEDDDQLEETMTVAEPEGEVGEQQPSDGEPEPDEEMVLSWRRLSRTADPSSFLDALTISIPTCRSLRQPCNLHICTTEKGDDALIPARMRLLTWRISYAERSTRHGLLPHRGCPCPTS